MAYWAFFIVILGLAVGSFLNVLIFRADELKSILYTRSKCPHCQKTIKWYDLFPVVSYVLLRGSCRKCGKKISIQYPLVEGGTAIIFLALYLTFGLTWGLIFYLLMFSLLIVIFVYDLKTQYILDAFSWPLLIIAILGTLLLGETDVTQMIYGIMVGGGVLAFLVIISLEEWMGIGDIIIGAAIGAMIGYPRALAFIFISFVLGSLVGLTLIAFKKKGIKDAVPFAPFLITSAFISLLWGQQLIDWYVGKIFLY